MPRSIHADSKVVPLAESLWERAYYAEERGHFDEAERLLRQSAAMGNMSAMSSLANLLDDRLHCPQEAVHWYKRCVAAGDASAAWNLAMHYIPLGQRRLYRYWMRKAAAMGEEDAVAEVTRFSDPTYMTKLPFDDID